MTTPEREKSQSVELVTDDGYMRIIKRRQDMERREDLLKTGVVTIGTGLFLSFAHSYWKYVGHIK